jgi:hypothetical protein
MRLESRDTTIDATKAMPSIQNVYYERQAGTARQCFVCRSPTTTVLATIDKKDFVYTCPKHLTDP